MFGYRGYKKSGFTLAEVLITLGIIGTVAAMTIPTLMMNYQKQVWESKLKKIYSITTNACERMLIEENVSRVNETALYGATTETERNEEARKYFKLMKNGVDVTGKGFSILLPDGGIIYLNATNDGFDFYTDVNGTTTRPNTVGRDEFAFRLNQDCAYDSDLGEGASEAYKDFNAVIENDWKIPNTYPSSNTGGS
jgi:prepilin-type N-terminal cleavage/methylation domain-containing protein